MRPNKLEAIGLALIMAMLSMVLLSFFIEAILNAPRSDLAYSPPSAANLLGTNDIRNDVLTDLVRSSRVSFTVGIIGALLSTVVGTLIGVVSGYRMGLTDDLIGGLTDLFMILPALPLMIVLAAYLGPSLWNVILVIGLLWWPGTARIMRARTMQLRSSPFVEGLVGIGAGQGHIILRHILPNVGDVVTAKFVTSVAHAILLEAGLSFVGLGDPEQSSWGMMLHFAMTRGGLLYGAWWVFIPAGICIAVTSLGFMLLGMGLEMRNRLKTKKLEAA